MAFGVLAFCFSICLVGADVNFLVISVQDGWCLYGALVGGTDCTAAREANELLQTALRLKLRVLLAASSYDDSAAYGGSGAWHEQCDS